MAYFKDKNKKEVKEIDNGDVLFREIEIDFLRHKCTSFFPQTNLYNTKALVQHWKIEKLRKLNFKIAIR